MRTLISRVIIHATVIVGWSQHSSAQDCRTETHIFWQPGSLLEAGDFHRMKAPSEKERRYCDSIGLCTVAYLGLWYKVDVPKRKRDRGKQSEKVYIVPAFEIGTSYRIGDTSAGVLEQQVVFDIHEYAARSARRDLKELHDSIPGYGVDYIFLETVMADAMGMKRAMTDAFTQQVYLKKEPDAYERWRRDVDKGLEETKEFATRSEDCLRFKLGKPLLENYIVSPTLMGAMSGSEK